MKRLITLLSLVLMLGLFAKGQTYLTESFEGTWSGTPAAPSGWTQTMIAAGTGSGSAINWTQNTWSGSAWSISCHGSPTGAQNGSSVAWFDDYNCMAGRIMRLETGNIDLSAATNPRVSFYFAANTSATFTLKLRASSDGGANWSDIQTIAKPGTTWTKNTILIPSGYKVANARIAFEITGAYGSYDAYVDNVIVDETPAPLAGTKTIKSSGGDYSTFTAAINALNDAGVGTGGVIFNVDDDLVLTEDPPAITATGTSGSTILFQRTGTGTNRPVIKPTGTTGTSDFGICISGGDYITFDGIDITINTGSAVEYGYIVRNASSLNGAQFNMIKNTKITLNRTNTSSIGILQTSSSSYGGGSSPSSDAGTSLSNKYYNITVENAYNGIWLFGSSAYYDASCEIGVTGGGTTTIGASSSNDIGNGSSTSYGIRSYYQKDVKVFNTEVRNITQTSTGSVYGISFTGAYGTCELYNNKIHDLTSTYANASTAPKLYGIECGTASAQTLNVYNNVIYNFSHAISSASSTTVAYGIYVSTTGPINLFFNSVRMNLGANASSNALYLSGSNCIVKNNILANVSTYNGTSKRYCFFAATSPLSSSNNILYVNTGAGANNLVGYGSSSDRASLQLFAASISAAAPVDGSESGSANYDPGFSGPTDLSLTGSSPARNSGTPITSPSITTDITGTSRDANRPNIGAYESAVTQTDQSAPVISNISISSGSSPVVSCVVTDNSASSNNATIRLWYRLGSSGAYTGIDADSKPSGAMNGTYTWSTSLASLSTGTYNFYIAARDDQGAGAGIWVNPIWSTSYAGFNAADPPNYTANPDGAANVRSFQKISDLAGGTYNVGTGETLQKLTDVANQLNNSTLLGDVIYELTSTYDGTAGETFPITFNQFLTSGGDWTVTIRVKASAGARTLSGSSTSQLIYLNGVDRLTIDGREGGTGSTKAFTLSNTSTSGTVMTFINDATLNAIKYCTIQGVNTSTSSGTIVFSTTTGTTGNDNNTIDYCDIKDGATKPDNGIYSSGTSSKENSGNVISNCNIYNFNGSTTTAGIYISSYSTGWTISGNSFYQAASYAGTGSTTAYGIYVATGNGFVITGNYIGGSASSCGSTAWTINGTTATFRFVGIYLSVGTTDATSVQGNVIKNFSWLSNSGAGTHPGVWCGIYNVAGNINIGNTTGNTIGETTGTGSVAVNITSTGGVTFGIANSSTGTINISNNSIGAITVTGNTTSISSSCMGISITSGTTVTVNSNTIGSTTTANSINASTASTNASGQHVTGILNSSSATISITNNTVANLNNNYAGTNSAGQIRGIITSSGVNTITGNTIRNLSTTSPQTGSTTSASVLGIAQSSTTAGQTVSQNAIYALSNSASSAAVYSIGLYYNGPTSGTNLVARNNIYNLTLSTSSTTASITGIQISGGLTTYQNNMIGLGDGLTTGYSITGINDVSGTNNYYFNSVYIGGSPGGSSSTATYAFNSNVTSNIRVFKDNIFFNARSNSAGTGKHYAVKYGGTGVNPTGLTADYNVMYVTGTGGVFGYYNSADVASMGAWRTATGQDNNSLNADPVFAAPTGSSPDLHIHATNSTPVEAAGTAIAGITDDFDGQTRADYTPTDIGADAGNFTGVDIVTPAISYTALTNTNSTANRTFSNVVITDASGINTADGTKPRVYYKKSTNANSLGATNDNTTDGWKYVECDVSPSPFGFTIDYTKLYDNGAVAPGTVIQYFVVAQDLAATPNVGINSGTFAATPASVALTGAAFPIGGTINSYMISYNFAGNVDVGTGQTFTTLTADDAGGLFKAINNGVVSGNFTATIVSDIVEPGTIALNQWTEEGAGSYTLTIQPDGTTERVISGAAVTSGNPMININGADRVTIDGRSGGSGMYLRFRNTNSTASNTGAAVQFTNGSTSCTLRNCILETNETTTSRGTVTIGSTGTNNVSILYCYLRDAVGGTSGAPYCGVYSSSTTNTVTLSYNDIFNWSNYGIYLSSVANTCTVSDNNFYNNLATPPSVAQYSIYIASGSGHSITGNFIGGQAAGAGGSSWTNSGAVSFYGIYLSLGTTTATSVQNNAIQNISLSSTSSASFYGIYLAAGTFSIGTTTGNTIGHASNSNSISISGTGSVTGIYSSGSTSTIQKNTIANITQSATAPGVFYGISLNSNFVLNASSNNIYKCGATSSSTGTNAVIGIYFTGASGGTNPCTISNNMISLGQGVTNNNIYKGIDDFGWTGNNLFLYYNSVRIQGTGNGSSSSYAYIKRDAPNETHRNNIYVNDRTGGTGYHHAIAATTVTGTFSSNYNVFSASDATKIGYWSSTAYNLAGWQTASGGDANTLEGNPGFVGPTDLHIIATSSLPSDNATPLNGTVDNDFDSEARSATLPDRGADEYTYTPPSVLDPTGVSATAAGSSQIDVAFTPNGNNNNVVIVWNNTGTFSTPSGTPPETGGSLAGGLLLYNGTTSPVNHVNIVTNTYYYKAFSYDGANYSTGVAVNATTLTVNNATALTATAVSKNEIDLTWTKNAANNDVMVATNSTSTFGIPTNGTAYAANDPISGGGTVIYNGPVSGFNHASLTPSTQYFYKAFSVDGGKNYSSGVTANATTLCNYPTITGTTPASRCGTGTVSLAASSTGGTITWYAASTGGTALGTGSPWTTPVISSTTSFYVTAETSSSGNVTIGSGASTTVSSGSSSDKISPFEHYYGGFKAQYLVKASELIAAGLSGGNITAVSFEIAAIGTTYNTFNLSLGHTAATALTTTFQTGLSAVYSASSVTPTLGIYTITFDTPFNWDGTSNLVIETCWSNVNYGGTGATVKYDSQSFVAESWYRNDNTPAGTLCANTTAGGTNSARPKMIFAGQSVCAGPRTAVAATVTTAPDLTITGNQTICNNSIATLSVTSNPDDYDSFIWSPTTNLFTDDQCLYAYSGTSATTVYFKSATGGTTTYTCNATNAEDCADNASCDIVNLPASTTITPSPAQICLSGSSTITAVPATGYGTATFQWQNSTNNVDFADITDANSISYTTPTITQTTYYKLLIKLGTNTCYESNVATVTVNNPQVTGTTPGSRCGTGTVTLGATGTGGTFTWYAASSGGTALGTGSPWQTPSISATTDFYVDAEYVTTSSGVVTIGSGTNTSGTGYGSDALSPYCTHYEDGKHQYLILGSELTSAGLNAGNITSLALNVATVGSPAMTSFAIALGQSASVTVLTSTYETGLTTVYSSSSYTPAGTGWQTLTFSTPFAWDGTSNLIVQICFGNNSSYSSSTSIYYSTTSANYHHYGYQDDGTGCAMTSPSNNGVNTSRANMQLGGTVNSVCASAREAVTATVTTPPTLTITPSFNMCSLYTDSLQVTSTIGNYQTYTWSPVTDLYTDRACITSYTAMTNASKVYVKPAAAGAIQYTCSGSETVNGCAATSVSTVTAAATPPAPTTTGYSICLGGTIPSGQGLQSTAVGGNITTGSQTVYFDVTVQPVETNSAPGNTVASATMTALPAGATVTGIVITYNNIEALGSSWQSDVRLGLSGAIENSAATGNGAASSNGIFNYTRTTTSGISVTYAGGTVNLLYWDNVNDNTGAEATFPTGTAVASLVINYTYPDPASVHWYLSATGGSSQGTGSPFNPIGIYPLNSNTPGTYTWYAEVQGGSCASPRTSCNLVIGSAVTTTATADPPTAICAGTEVILTAHPSGGGLPYTYSWKVGGTEVSTLASFSATPSSTTTYNLTVTDNCTQTANASVTVTVNAIPTASAGSNSPVCAGQTLNLTGTTDIGTSFSWTGPNGFSSLVQNPSITNVTIAASGTYSFYATASGCTSPAGTVDVVINPAPGAVTITPASASIDEGYVQQLVASGGNIGGQVILTEDFNGTSNNWTTINNSINGDDPELAAWTLRPDGYEYYDIFHSNDNSQFYLSNSDEQGSGGTTATILQSPEFSTVGFSEASVNFFHYFEYLGDATAKVEASTDGTNWTTLITYSSVQGDIDAFDNSSIALTSGFLEQSTVYVRFKYDDTYGYYWAIDNVTISGTAIASITWSPLIELYTNAGATTPYTGGAATTVYAKPSSTTAYTATATSPLGCTNSSNVTITVNKCTAPTGLTANSVGSSTANLAWTPGGSETSWEYVYGLAPLAVPTGSGTATTSSTVNPISGLSPGTDYEFYVRAVCPYTHSAWSSPGYFTTACAAIESYPWSVGFESNWPPNCWTDNTNAKFGWDRSTRGSAHSGSHWAYCNLANAELSTPELDLAADSRLIFWYRVEDENTPQSMTINVESTILYQITDAMNTDYQMVEIDLSDYTGQTIEIAFVGGSGDDETDPGICLDDVKILTYTNVWTGNISTSWTDPGNWGAGLVPGIHDRVIIPTNPTNNRFPAIGDGVTATCYNVVLQSGATIDVQTGGSLNVLHP